MSPKRNHKAAIHHGEENPGVREVLGTEKSKALIGFHNFDRADWGCKFNGVWLLE